MPNLTANLPHMIMATITTAAAVALALAGTISGTDAIVLISAAGGFTIGASASAAGAVAATPATAEPPMPAEARPAPIASPAPAAPTQ